MNLSYQFILYFSFVVVKVNIEQVYNFHVKVEINWGQMEKNYHHRVGENLTANYVDISDS